MKTSANRRDNAPLKPHKPRQQGFRLLPEGKRKCSKCEDIKEESDFYVDKSRPSGNSARCKACINESKRRQREDPNYDHLTCRRAWAKDNRNHLREWDHIYKANNRSLHALTEARRRARKYRLPDTLTNPMLEEIIRRFEGKCALCEEDYEHLDHFIPLKSGHVGTVAENMVPLCKTHNLSKGARNPFMWADMYLSKHERERFDALVMYLTELNGIAGVADFKAHVYLCFK